MKSTVITALLGFASLAISAPAQLVERQASLEQVTDTYMFDISIAEFIANRDGKVGPPELNWESNGCTASPDNPFGFNCTVPSSFLTRYLVVHFPSTLNLCANMVIRQSSTHATATTSATATTNNKAASMR